MIKITIPSVGESISEVTLLKWNKQSGEYVEKDEVIAEIESEKASFEISAEQSGTLKIKVEEGETLQIGDEIGEITENKKKANKKKNTPKQKEKKANNLSVTIPSVGESISEVTLLKWLKHTHDFVQRDDVIAEVESEKASFEISAELSGNLVTKADEGAVLQIGDEIALIDTNAVAPKEDAPIPEEKKQTINNSSQSQIVKSASATPLAMAVSNDVGVSIKDISPKLPHLKITKSDVLEQMFSFSKPISQKRSSDKKKISSLRKTISRRLVEAKNSTAMLTTFNEVDMSAVINLRKEYKEAFKEKYQVGLGFMSFFTRACCIALQEIPTINAYLNQEEIIYHHYCDISIAVSTPRGLVVPVIRNAESMHMHEIEQAVVLLAKKARDSKLSMDDMQGGTFTLTNGGVFGSLLSTPIINPPQSAILGMHKIEERPVVINKKIEIKPMMYLALSYDHRIIDGKESVTFLIKVKELLEHPDRLITGKNPAQILIGL